MIEEIIIKFGTKLKPTKVSWKSQLYKTVYEQLEFGSKKVYLCSFVKKTNQVQTLSLCLIIKQANLKYNNMFVNMRVQFNYI